MKLLARAGRVLAAALLAAVTLLLPAAGGIASQPLRLAATTSVENSGLAAHLLARFTEATGIEVELIVAGTGQALRLGRNGDVDALLVHAREDEEAFVAAGYAKQRRVVMANDFVIVGPRSDPAGIRGREDAVEALRTIAATRSVFLSRGDDSGTHKRELALWAAAGMDAGAIRDDWYRRTGAGQGATLNTAAAMDGYTLVDRATWTSFANKGELELLVAGDRRLFNPYGYLQVNPARHPHVNAVAARRLGDWLVSAEGQAAIAAFRIDGEQMFTPIAGRDD